jgi:hypothetical protein
MGRISDSYSSFINSLPKPEECLTKKLPFKFCVEGGGE